MGSWESGCRQAWAPEHRPAKVTAGQARVAALLAPASWVHPGKGRLGSRESLHEEGHSQPLGSLAGARSLEQDRNNADGAILPGWLRLLLRGLFGAAARPSAPWRRRRGTRRLRSRPHRGIN